MDKSRIIIYGASDDGKSFFEYLHPLVLLGLIEVVAFADNDTRMWGRDIGGVPVVPPMTIVEYKYDYVIVTPIFFDEISVQLSDLGISFDKLIPLHANHRRNFGRAAREFDNVKILITYHSKYLTDNLPASALVEDKITSAEETTKV